MEIVHKQKVYNTDLLYFELCDDYVFMSLSFTPSSQNYFVFKNIQELLLFHYHTTIQIINLLEKGFTILFLKSTLKYYYNVLYI